MGVFLTRRLRLPDAGPRGDDAPRTPGFITGLLVVFTPLLGCGLPARPAPAVAWVGRRCLGASACTCSRAPAGTSSCAATAWCCSARVAFAGHILVTARGVARPRRGRAAGGAARALRRRSASRSRPLAGDLEAPEGVDRLVGADRHLAGGQRARLLRPDLRPAARAAGPHRPDPGERARVRGLFGYLLADDRLCAVSWLGAALILAAIVAVEVVPRLRPPRPLPEG